MLLSLTNILICLNGEQMNQVDCSIVIPFVWEKCAGFTYRAMVIGGWVLQTVEGESTAMVFIPDEGHQWALK